MGLVERYKQLKSRGMNLKTRMLATFIPVVVMTLLVTGYLTYQVSAGSLESRWKMKGASMSQAWSMKWNSSWINVAKISSLSRKIR